MSKRNNELLVVDMLEAAERIQAYTKGFDFERFSSDQKTLDAVVRNFEIIGEASTRITAEFQATKTQIPWKQLRGYRNRLIHEYFGVDYLIIWEIIESELPKLVDQLKSLSN
ncbi:MAG: DUF86 domain-containing protein [Bacteroidetes bacterium]|nr:MAG: DUF86 domain-containing protein [Bacteroidota bacterium]